MSPSGLTQFKSGRREHRESQGDKLERGQDIWVCC